MKKEVDFVSFLAIVSILSFLTVVLKGLIGVDIDPYVQGLIFVVIGIGLAIIGNIMSIVNYLEEGLNSSEIAHILTVVVGLFSILVGLFMMPVKFLANVNIPAMDGIKVVVATLAIVLIAIQAWFIRK